MWLLSIISINLIYAALAVGVIGLLVIRFVPSVLVNPLIQIPLYALVACSLWAWGAKHQDEITQIELAKLTAQIQQAEKAGAEVAAQVEIQVKEKIKVVKQNVYITKTVIKEVAGPQIDSMCTLPVSAVSLHNSSASNQVPASARGTNDAASTTKGDTQ